MANKAYIIGKKSDFKKLFSTVNSISEEALFHFEKDSITVKCHNKSKTALLEMMIKKNYFQKFLIEVPIEVGVNVSRMLKVIEMCGDQIHLLINDSLLIFSEDMVNVKATVPQICMKGEEIVTPTYRSFVSVVIKLDYLIKNLSHLIQFSNFVEINIRDKLTLKATSAYGERINIMIPIEPRSIIKGEKSLSIVVAIDVMKDMLSNLDIDKYIKLNVDASMPAIEMIYEEENLYIRTLFSKYIR